MFERVTKALEVGRVSPLRAGAALPTQLVAHGVTRPIFTSWTIPALDLLEYPPAPWPEFIPRKRGVRKRVSFRIDHGIVAQTPRGTIWTPPLPPPTAPL
jgi:hypothetical protein